jgi:hypothetical protein
MAVTAEPTGSELQIRVENGTSATGATLYRNLTYRNVKDTALDNDVKAVADALGLAQTQTVAAIFRTNTLELTGEPV